MTRRHSLVTRALALVLALVLVASNGAGLTLGAKAAETGNLFDLIKGTECSTDELIAVLGCTDVIKGLAGKNATITYDEAPDAEASLHNGVLKVEISDGWIPATYNGTAFGEGVNGVWTANTTDESVNVVFTQDLKADEANKALQAYVSNLAGQAAEQKSILDGISGQKAMFALEMLEEDFIYDMMDAVDNLTIDQLQVKKPTAEELEQELGVEFTPEYFGITVVYVDYDQDGDVDDDDKAAIDAEVQAQIDAKVEEEINKYVETELEAVKDSYISIIKELLNRLVDGEDRYMKYTNKRGNPVYQYYLRVYAALSEYKNTETGGVAHYYQNYDYINDELIALSASLDKILGEKTADGYANAYVINAMLDDMGYGPEAEITVTADDLGTMSDRMRNAANTLPNYYAFTTELNMDSADLKATCDALAACGNVNALPDALILTSAPLVVQDDSKRFVNTTIGTEPYAVPCAYSETVLTDAEIQTIVDNIVAMAASMHYTVDAEKIAEQLVGKNLVENITVDSYSKLATYSITVENECGDDFTVEFLGNATSVSLPVGDGEVRTYHVNGVKWVSEESVAIVIEGTVDELRALDVVLNSIDNKHEARLVALVDALNNAIGEGSFVLTKENGTYTGLTANITMADIGTFGETLINKGFNDVKLDGEKFLYVDETTQKLQLSLNALVVAMLKDESFGSAKLIDLGINGQGNLLNTSIQMPGFDMVFVLNLTAVPAQMSTVANGLNAIKDVMTFNAGNGRMNVQLTIPEKVYEAYVTAAVLSGNMSDNDVADLNNKVTMEFMADYFELLKNSKVNTETYTKTLALMGIDKDLTGYEDYYQLLKTLVSNDKFNYTIDEKLVTVTVGGHTDSLDSALAVFGMSLEDLTKGLNVVAEEDIVVDTYINLTNDAPKFEALVIDPARLNDAGYKAKIMAANYFTDLTAAELQGPAAIMLLGNVDGNLTFNHTTILDLNGFTVNGSITANAPLYIVDSSLDTVSGAGVTGTVTGDVRVLAGTYSDAAAIEAFLRDGYYMDGNSVKNAMYEISNGKIVVDGDLYLENVDGYLPAAHYMAADIAIDLALNYYFAAGFNADGDGIYSIEFIDLVNILETKDIGNIADQTLACIDAAGISSFMNKIIADLLDFAAISDAVENNTSLGSYTFTAYPWSVAVRHETAGDYVTFDVLPASEGKSYTLDLTVKIPEGDKKDKLVKALNILANRVVESNVEVTIDQPVRDGKNLVVGGSGTASFTLDFSDDQKYNEMLAGVIAYFNEEVESVLVDEKMCIINLNNAMSKVTVGQFFTAVKGVIENPNITFADIAAKLKVELTDAQLAKLEDLYADFKVVCTKVINKFDLTTNSTAPLSELADGNGAFVVNGDIQPHTADIYRKGFGLIANLGYTDATLTVQLAPKCTEILGDVDRNGRVDTNDATWILQYAVDLKTEDDLHMCVGDVDGNGRVDTNDATLILQYAVDIITKFPAEK